MARPYLGGSSAGIKSVSADVTLQPADSGKKIIVNASAAGNFTITLPEATAKKGNEYDIILGATSNAASEVVIVATYPIVGGVILNSTGVVTVINTSKTRGFGDASDAGSRMHIVFDGSQWIVLNANSDVAFITDFT